MEDIYYEKFLSDIYDDAPYFGQARSKDLNTFNNFYYQNLINEGEKILEFGSGTGMLTVPLAQRGYKIDSVDISPFMHDVLTRKLNKEKPEIAKNVNQIVADALSFKSDNLYSSIVMPEGILIALPDSKLQMGLLQSCHRNLVKGGRIYTDFFQPRFDVIYADYLHETTRFRTKSGEPYLFDIKYTSNKYTQIQNWNVTFSKTENGTVGEIIELDVKFRYLFYSEIQHMLALCGFKVIEIDKDYAGGRGFSVIGEKL